MAKRIVSSSVNWSLVTKNLSPSDVTRVMPLKIATDKYLRDIASKNAELPKIDWDGYRKKIATPGLVDSFQKSYESLKIPYPSDQGVLAETEQYNAKLLEFVNDQLKEVLKKIEELKEALKKLEAIMPYSSMTLEELYLAAPKYRLDLDNPKFYPQYIKDLDRQKENTEKH